jgi:hypothetical protein
MAMRIIHTSTSFHLGIAAEIIKTLKPIANDKANGITSSSAHLHNFNNNGNTTAIITRLTIGTISHGLNINDRVLMI